MKFKIGNKCLLKISIKKEIYKTVDEDGRIVEIKENVGRGISIELFNRLVTGISWDGRLLPYFCYFLFNPWKSSSKKKWIPLTTWRFETYKSYRYCCDLFGWNKNLTPYFRIPKKYLEGTT